jgi:hypothetical protein
MALFKLLRFFEANVTRLESLKEKRRFFFIRYYLQFKIDLNNRRIEELKAEIKNRKTNYTPEPHK